MKRSFPSILAVFLYVLSSPIAQSGEPSVSVRDPWIREAPPNASVLAGYMVLENHTGRSVSLLRVASPAFRNAMIHRTVTQGGVAKMVHMQRVEIPPGGKVVFEPGGYHLMLMNPKEPLRAGDRAKLELEFTSGLTESVDFSVRKAVESARMGHMHR